MIMFHRRERWIRGCSIRGSVIVGMMALDRENASVYVLRVEPLSYSGSLRFVWGDPLEMTRELWSVSWFLVWRWIYPLRLHHGVQWIRPSLYVHEAMRLRRRQRRRTIGTRVGFVRTHWGRIPMLWSRQEEYNSDLVEGLDRSLEGLPLFSTYSSLWLQLQWAMWRMSQCAGRWREWRLRLDDPSEISWGRRVVWGVGRGRVRGRYPVEPYTQWRGRSLWGAVVERSVRRTIGRHSWKRLSS